MSIADHISSACKPFSCWRGEAEERGAPGLLGMEFQAVLQREVDEVGAEEEARLVDVLLETPVCPELES